MRKLLLVLPFLMLGISAFAQQAPLMEVEGQSEISILPDEALIMVNLSQKAMKVADATNALNRKTKDIQDALKKTGVQGYELTVDNYFVNVNRVYTKGSSRDSGYVASQNVKIRVKSTGKDLTTITETLHKSGNMGFHMQFVMSDALRKSTESKLLQLALENAKQKADVIAKTMNITSYKLHRVSYGSSGNGFVPVMRNAKMEMMAMSADMDQEPILIPEEQKLTDRVVVSFSFEM
jgi:uncharacterized protein